MRGYVQSDDRQRSVHYLVRTHELVVGPEVRPEHLGEDELAGMIAGTLFKTECGRVENHLLACERCRRHARSLHEEYEAGVVPILLRRAAPADGRTGSFRRTLTRHYSHWIIALSAFAAVVVLQLSISSFLDSGEVTCHGNWLVVSRVGTPVVKREGSVTHLPAQTGAWLFDGNDLILATGDVLELLGGDGTVTRVTASGFSEPERPAQELLRAVYRNAWRERRTIRDVAETDVKPGMTQRLRVLHPRGLIWSGRPTVRWTDEGLRHRHLIALFRVGGFEEEIFRLESQSDHVRFPQSALSLVRGGKYELRVTPEPLDRSATITQTFHMLDDPDAARVTKELASIAAIVGRGPNLIRAEYYRQQKLMSEAKEELEALRRNDPNNVNVLVLLKVVYRALGLHEEEASALKLIRKRA